jgi:hypothetical protein
MTWWQVLLVFVGIPIAISALITVVVLRFTTARVPDGLRSATEQRDVDGVAPEGQDNPGRDDPASEPQDRPDGDESRDH